MTDYTNLPSVERPWMKFFSDATKQVAIPEETLYEYLLSCNSDYPNDIAILYRHIRISYGELFVKIDQCAQGLYALGVRRDDIVTVAMPSVPEFIYVLFALNRLGAVSNIIHPLAGAEEICTYVNKVKSKVLVMFTGTYAIMRESLDKTSVKKALVVSPAQSLPSLSRLLYDWISQRQRVKESAVVVTWDSFVKMGKGMSLPEPTRATDDYAVISYTGGTTGEPKGVICTNRSIHAEIVQSISERSHMRQECMMTVLPPFINYSLINSHIEPLFCGFKTLLIPHYIPTKFIDYVNRYKVNHIQSIPAYWEIVLQLPHIEKQDFSRLGFVVSGGEKIDVSVEQQLNKLMKEGGASVTLIKGMGMTELMSSATSTYPWCNREGSVGIPNIMNNCRVVDVQTGEELSYNEEGELCFSGPTVMVGYYNNPEATADIIKTDADGTRWLHTGDVGYMTEDGILFITGRLKRLLMQKDENGMVSKIFPEHIEGIIAQMPEVEECCVVGKADAARITLPMAYIVASQGAKDMEQAVRSWCQERLPAYMEPAEVHVLDSLPRTDRGKVDYRALETLNSADTI